LVTDAAATRNRLRIGIDVGGTFTDVVAVDALSRELVACVKVPTTHDAAEGVAAGIVLGIERLLQNAQLQGRDVGFIAHSTTQATNALLEGDVARVGVVGLASGAGGWYARRQMRFAPVLLARGCALDCDFAFADPRQARAAVEHVIAGGAQAVAVSQPFGVDRPRAESDAVAYARQRGIDATCGHDVSSMYGLRARTRTAALNAAILPRMLRTSRMTAAAVAQAQIPAPLMIMRSDGGVMDVREIERRPILTLLSGPAAGIAGALLYENLTDGIFIEVGGTSSDLSAIRAGRPQMHPARIGGHRTMLRTLDVRTLGIAGGSMARIEPGGVADVGPRSAHIAGCTYAAFSQEADLDGASIETIAPSMGDPRDYVVFSTTGGGRIALTTTCAANALEQVPEGAYARGNSRAARKAFELLAEHLRSDWQTLAEAVVNRAAAKLRAAIEELINDYRLERTHVVLVGGGGGAGAIVPYTASVMALPFRIARDAEVIAPIGVALALVRDVVERIIVSPTPADVARVRREAIDRVVNAGAAPNQVEVVVEIDTAANTVRATASGSTDLSESAALTFSTDDERRLAAAKSLRRSPAELDCIAITNRLAAYRYARDFCLVDQRGVARFVLRAAALARTTAGDIDTSVRRAIDRATRYGDVGRSLPALYLVRGERVAAYEGLASSQQAVSLAQEELEGCDPSEEIALFTITRPA
jgi:N-methylhydantoinase A